MIPEVFVVVVGSVVCPWALGSGMTQDPIQKVRCGSCCPGASGELLAARLMTEKLGWQRLGGSQS